MKILMLTWEYPPRVVGGIARVVHDLSQRLIKDGHEVTVITYKEGNVPYFEDDKGVKVYRVDNYMINPNNFIDWILQLNFNLVSKANEIIAKEGKFDVIHAHDWLVAYSAKTLKNSYDIPIVATIHATESGRNSGIHDETQRYINDTEWMLTYEANEVIVNSDYMKCELQRNFGLPFEKINVVPNGVNLTMYSGIQIDYDFRRNYATDNEKIILYAGRLVYEKGVQHLIAAMPKILQNYHDQKLGIQENKEEQIQISEQNLEAILDGMESVTDDQGGTAYSVFRNFPIGVGGKTGSAETSTGKVNAWFVGFAPFETPEIAVVVLVENGGHGYYTAEAVREIMEQYFGMNIEQIQEDITSIPYTESIR